MVGSLSQIPSENFKNSSIWSFATSMLLLLTSIDKVIIRLAKAHGVTKKKERDSLKKTCIESVKMDIFSERYGHLFQKDKNGELSYSLPMMRKITGLPLYE